MEKEKPDLSKETNARLQTHYSFLAFEISGLRMRLAASIPSSCTGGSEIGEDAAVETDATDDDSLYGVDVNDTGDRRASGGVPKPREASSDCDGGCIGLLVEGLAAPLFLMFEIRLLRTRREPPLGVST
jgi:hypothetical protein